jgi:hypothetical protein
MLLLLHPSIASADEPTTSLVDSRKIWDSGDRITSTDLVWFRGQWICVLETDKGLKLIGSKDGKRWGELSTVASDTIRPLRSARLSATTDGRVMLTAVAPAIPNGGQSKSWFSYDGVKWTKPAASAERDYLVCNVFWHVGVAYSFQRGTTCGNADFRIGVSHDHGQSFRVKHEETGMFGAGKGALVFSQDYGYCVMTMHRRDNTHGLLGVSEAPFWQWKWKKLPKPVKHPNAIRTKTGTLLVAAGLPDENGKMRTMLCRLDPDTPALVPLEQIPTSQPCFVGLAKHNGQIFLTYHRDADNGSTVQLARVSRDE